MTTSAITVDNRTAVTTDCGPGYYGTYFDRTHSGLDGPRSEEHPYSMQSSSFIDPLITWSQGSVSGADGTYGSCFGGVYFDDLSITPDDEYDITNQCAEKFRGHQFNGAVNLGEARESVKMIGDTARVLAKSILALKKGDVIGALDSLGLKPKSSLVRDTQLRLRNGAASAWLGLTYGWKPLLGAVNDAAQAAASNLRPRSVRVSARVRHSGKCHASYPYFEASGDAKLGVNLIWKVAEVPEFTTLQEFGFNDPSLVAWELLPFSFVADWFVPIGNFLQARASLGLVQGTYIRTVYFRSRGTVSPQSSTTVDASFSGGIYIQSNVSVDRSVGRISSLPLPQPQLKNPLSISHAISGIALLQAVFGKK